jgi:hypothetical protein
LAGNWAKYGKKTTFERALPKAIKKVSPIKGMERWAPKSQNVWCQQKERRRMAKDEVERMPKMRVAFNKELAKVGNLENKNAYKNGEMEAICRDGRGNWNKIMN